MNFGSKENKTKKTIEINKNIIIISVVAAIAVVGALVVFFVVVPMILSNVGSSGRTDGKRTTSTD
jgi:uncharacterized membrane protein